MDRDGIKRDLVTISLLSELTGMTERSIRGKIGDGKWLKNKHYFTRGRRTMIDYNEVMRWFKDED